MGKKRINSRFINSRLFLAFSMAFTVWQAEAAGGSAYIDALNAEVGGPPPVAAPPPQDTPGVTVSRKQSLASDLTSGLSHQDFENELKNGFLGSYLFYKKLNATDKGAVYSYYQEGHTIDDIREKIKSLLTK